MSCAREANLPEVSYTYDEASVEDIAKHLFSKSPEPAGSHVLFSSTEKPELKFHILLTFLMEGVLISFQEIGNISLDTLDSDIILSRLKSLDPWVESVGFSLDIQKLPVGSDINNRYCRILMRNSRERLFFTYKNIESDYYFLVNCADVDRNKIYDYYATVELGSVQYKIRFFAGN